jgi:hypothetical protein
MDPKRLFTFFKPIQSSKASSNFRLVTSHFGKTHHVSPPPPPAASSILDISEDRSDPDDYDFAPSGTKPQSTSFGSSDPEDDFAFVKSNHTVT